MGKLKRLLYIISLYIYLNKSLFILKFVITNRDNDLVCKVSYIWKVHVIKKYVKRETKKEKIQNLVINFINSQYEFLQTNHILSNIII